jgi:hypothetical protein
MFDTRAIIPADVDAFDFMIDVSGENMATQKMTFRITVIRKAPQEKGQ